MVSNTQRDRRTVRSRVVEFKRRGCGGGRRDHLNFGPLLGGGRGLGKELVRDEGGRQDSGVGASPFASKRMWPKAECCTRWSGRPNR